ncbi:MAG: hypothetical protein HY917_03035, partial [Candidatus Diapherotrites archaeon]|nr:hypothetical protein [Candidatus Diapherotrites archaeon]
MKDKLIETYELQADNVSVDVHLVDPFSGFVREYHLQFPEYGAGTAALLHSLKKSILADAAIKTENVMDARFIDALKKRFSERAHAILSKELPELGEESRKSLVAILLHEMLGLGKIEFLINDPNLEEIVVNSSEEPVWVFHKTHGWLKTNIVISPESEIQNYSSIIARRV